jgi:hypothetical protein
MARQDQRKTATEEVMMIKKDERDVEERRRC